MTFYLQWSNLTNAYKTCSLNTRGNTYKKIREHAKWEISVVTLDILQILLLKTQMAVSLLVLSVLFEENMRGPTLSNYMLISRELLFCHGPRVTL